MAARWEAELREGRYKAPIKASWAEFCERFEAEKGASLSENTRNSTRMAFNHLQRVLNPSKLVSLIPSIMSQFQARLRQEGMKETTIATHLRHLRAALRWAVTVDLLPAVPELHMPRRGRGQSLMRGRPITCLEFEKMLEYVAKVRPRDPDVWRHHLNGLWLSGLRLDESLILAWNGDGPFVVDLTGVKPATLQLLMRHRSIETTMKYYVDQDSHDVVDKLWATYASAHSGAAK